AEGRNIEMKNATEEELRARVLEQLGERAIEDAHKQYQADATLAPAALARLVAPADDKAILAELAKAQEYLQADRYAVQPTALTLFARADKETDHLTELRLTETAAVTLTAKGVGALSGAGDIPVTFVLTKTVVYSNFAWKAAK
ncbi:MAG: hypothetical protein LBB50_04530, partial [Oscillospiraceae bacterium]|nr:hypothetical protein [Oscillospiraceae bacterium]